MSLQRSQTIAEQKNEEDEDIKKRTKTKTKQKKKNTSKPNEPAINQGIAKNVASLFAHEPQWHIYIHPFFCWFLCVMYINDVNICWSQEYYGATEQ